MSSEKDPKAERTFLHDISNPLGTITLLLESAIDSAGKPGVDPELQQELKTVLDLVEKVNEMIRQRRQAAGG